MVQEPMEGAKPSSLISRLARWVATHLAATVVAVAGFIVYVIVRGSYATFYERFDVEPEEVGLGQTQIITHTAWLLFVLVVLMGAVLGLGYVILRAVGFRRTLDRLPANAPLRWRLTAFTTTPYFMIVLPLVVLLVFFGVDPLRLTP